jgi:hypothetical protein
LRLADRDPRWQRVALRNVEYRVLPHHWHKPIFFGFGFALDPELLDEIDPRPVFALPHATACLLRLLERQEPWRGPTSPLR